LRIEGRDNADITIDGGDWRKAKKPVEAVDGASESSVRVRS